MDHLIYIVEMRRKTIPPRHTRGLCDSPQEKRAWRVEVSLEEKRKPECDCREINARTYHEIGDTEVDDGGADVPWLAAP